MPQFLYRLEPLRPQMLSEGPTEAEAKALEAHVNYLSTLASRNQVFMAGRTQTQDANTFGLVIFQADTQAAAEAVMQQDPAVAHQVMRAELFPYRVAVLAEDIEAMNIRP